MCLDIVLREYKKPITVIAYKIFCKRRQGKLAGLFYPARVHYVYGRKYVTKDTEGRIACFNGSNETYSLGFHAYCSKKRAKEITFGNRVLVRVQLTGVHTVGIDSGRRVYVGTGMKILKR